MNRSLEEFSASTPILDAPARTPRPRRRFAGSGPRLKVLSAFGTRPEFIKFLPVLLELESRRSTESVTVFTGQHGDLVTPLIDAWDVQIDHDLSVMTESQTLNFLMARLTERVDAVLAEERPDVVLVQGDTTTALATTMACWHRRVPVAHIEAGLRSGQIDSPFPEEANRRMIGVLASLHFAPTRRNADALRAEGIADTLIHTCGNTIVDAIGMLRDREPPSPDVARVLAACDGRRLITMTTHRRESHGPIMRQRFRVLKAFLATRPDVSVIFPVHPNPAVREAAEAELGGVPNVHLTAPMTYTDFLHCLAASWVIVSDSGGVQEEAPSLGKPLLIIRPDTERPEVVECGIARLVGQSLEQFEEELDALDAPGSWIEGVGPMANPFGNGDTAQRIVSTLVRWKAKALAAGGVR